MAPLPCRQGRDACQRVPGGGTRKGGRRWARWLRRPSPGAPATRGARVLVPEGFESSGVMARLDGARLVAKAGLAPIRPNRPATPPSVPRHRQPRSAIRATVATGERSARVNIPPRSRTSAPPRVGRRWRRPPMTIRGRALPPLAAPGPGVPGVDAALVRRTARRLVPPQDPPPRPEGGAPLRPPASGRGSGSRRSCAGRARRGRWRPRSGPRGR